LTFWVLQWSEDDQNSALLSFWRSFLLAFSLRLYRLDAQELWGDESVSVGSRRLSEVQVLLGKPTSILHCFSLRCARRCCYWHEPVVHSFCVCVLGCARRPLVYRIGQRTISRQVGALAALFAAVSALQVFYSQEARMYTMATAWAAASLWCTVELLRPASPPLFPKREKGMWIAFHSHFAHWDVYALLCRVRRDRRGVGAVVGRAA